VTSPSVNSPSGVSATFVYDADRELVDTTDADGRRTTYAYNALGNQTGETWVGASPSEKITYTYDSDSELTGAADSFATLTFSYDNGGNLKTEATSGPGTGQPTVTLTYNYDPSHDLISISDSLTGSGATGQGITSYVYDNALRLGTITQSAGGTSDVEILDTYDQGGRLTEQSRPGTSKAFIVTSNYSYDQANDLLQVNNKVGTQTNPAAESTQTFNNAAQVLTDSLGSNSNSYTYDPDGQLTNSSGSFNATYSYDQIGNRNSTGYTTGVGNEMTNSPGVTYTYDNDGNIVAAKTSSGTTTYTYDYLNRLTNVDINGTMAATYTYDALGRRIGIDDSGTQTWTVYNGKTADDNPYADFNSSGGLKMRYVDGLAVDEVLARTDSSGNVAWYLTDQLGSVVALANNSGTVLDQIVYDPFGNIVTQTNASEADRFMFAGMEYDSTTGLYYDHARYYNSVTGRFVSQDPKGFNAGDTNLYRYTGNDPINNTDKTGLDDLWDKLWPANLTILPGYPGGNPPWIVQPGVSTDPQSPVDGPGTWKRVDGLWTLGGYLKIPTGAQVTITPSPTGFTIVSDTPVEWFPIRVRNPQGDNPAAGEPPGTNVNKPAPTGPGPNGGIIYGGPKPFKYGYGGAKVG
jgi:RHS repeat-associated protein